MHRVGGRQFTMPQFVVTQVVPAIGGHAPRQNAMPTPGLLPALHVHPGDRELVPHWPVELKAVPPSSVLKLHSPVPLSTQ